MRTGFRTFRSIPPGILFPCDAMQGLRNVSSAASGAQLSPSASAAKVSTSKSSSGKKRGSTNRQRSVSDLRTLPGVGVKNEQLLVSKGIQSVENLKTLYLAKFREQTADMHEYLQTEVGIRNQYCASIVKHFSQDDDLTEKPQKLGRSERITLSVEGNISSGKSTFLNWLMEEPLQVAGICEVVPEPVERWQHVGGNQDNNLLQRFYGNAAKYAYEFQNYVFLTRLQQNHETWAGEKPLRILERSVFSDRLVFVRAVHEARWLTDLQLQLYDSWFNPMLSEVPGLIPDGFIYLRADPSTCLRRLNLRGRKEESSVPEDYLAGLHAKHEEWFCGQKQKISSDSKMINYAQSSDILLPHDLPKCLQDSVIWLGDNGVFSSESGQNLPTSVQNAIRMVPALVLDCNTDIDVVHDMDAKKEYTNKVLAYYHYVKKLRQRSPCFWNNPDAEELRIKWDLVNKHPLPDLKSLLSQNRGMIQPHHKSGYQLSSEFYRHLNSNSGSLVKCGK